MIVIAIIGIIDALFFGRLLKLQAMKMIEMVGGEARITLSIRGYSTC